jgi:hypothetical protein
MGYLPANDKTIKMRISTKPENAKILKFFPVFPAAIFCPLFLVVFTDVRNWKEAISF